MPTRDNEQANAQRRIVYAENRDKNNKRQRLLYRVARLPVDMSCPVSLPEPSNIPSLRPSMQNQSSTHLNDAHQRFCKKIDQLHDMHVCSICKECYLGIVTKKFHDAYTCSHCILERKGHLFSFENNMDAGIQPPVHATLTQVEEMLISHANLVL